MNAPERFPSIPAHIGKDVRDAFLIFDPEDRYHASLAHGEADAREIIAGIKDTASVRVHRVTPGEIVRDVTQDFFPDETETPEYAAYERAASVGDRRHQLAREIV